MSGPAKWHSLPASFRRYAAGSENAVLLETARPEGSGSPLADEKSLLFLDPVQELVARDGADLQAMMRAVDGHVAEGAFVAGYFTYECGATFVGLAPEPRGADVRPLAWLGVYRSVVEFDHMTGMVHGALPAEPIAGPNADAEIVAEGMEISREAYTEALERIQEHLQAGHTYQVNFTDWVVGQTTGTALEVYETLLRQQPVSFAAFVNGREGAVLSFSPELFYRTAEGRVLVRPMKGTWPRGLDLGEDRAACDELRSDAKNRSEHIMIVDLLRNDLGRICEFGTVKVEKLFEVEAYSTLLQMTSTCSGKLREGVSSAQVFATLFPSGSITGAPKRRTMEIIREVERPRGVYTGAIGYFGPHGRACFNVAIRTVDFRGGLLRMGVGGGITAGSVAAEEYEECLLKAKFLTSKRQAFALIETMRCKGGVIALAARHRARMAASAAYFGIRLEEDSLWSQVREVASRCGDGVSKVRVELDELGMWSIRTERLENVPWAGRVLLAEERVQAREVFQRHKTTRRALYERALAKARAMGFDEVLFLNEESHVAEGSISNVLLRGKDGWVTPSVSSGALPGVQREVWLETTPGAEAREVRLEDLLKAERVCLCNALRGVRAVQSIEREDGTVMWLVARRG